MKQPTSTLERAVKLMDCFSEEQPFLGVREAARLAGISSSTAGRVLGSLKDLGLLVQDAETRKYALGGKVLAWAEVYSATLDVRNFAQPYMQDLQRSTGETVSVYVLEGTNRVCVERLESDQNVRVVAHLGRNIPLYAGSAGKLFLAYMAQDARARFLEQTELEPITPFTITDPDELNQQAHIIRQQGYAISHREWTVDASGVAAPIFNQRGQMIAALTVSGPTQRFGPDNLEKIIQACTWAAQQISKLLGYSSPHTKPSFG